MSPLRWTCKSADKLAEGLRARGHVVSERTVGHHLAHIYDKTGRRTRAGAAVFALEHGLLPELPPPHAG